MVGLFNLHEATGKANGISTGMGSFGLIWMTVLIRGGPPFGKDMISTPGGSSHSC